MVLLAQYAGLTQVSGLQLQNCSELEFSVVILKGWRKEGRWALDVLQGALIRCVKNPDVVDEQFRCSAVCGNGAGDAARAFQGWLPRLVTAGFSMSSRSR